MALGLVAMAWNGVELRMRDLIKAIVCKGVFESGRLAEIIVTELGTVGLTQALNCFSAEMPEEESELSVAISHLVEMAERLKAYRNYYIHGVRGVTAYGFTLTDEMLDQDTPLTEALDVGPFAHVYQKTAKGKSKFYMEYLRVEKLTWLNNQLADLEEYIGRVSVSVNHYLQRLNWRESAPLPHAPPLPSRLVKPDTSHPKLKLPPALRHWPKDWDKDEDSD